MISLTASSVFLNLSHMYNPKLYFHNRRLVLKKTVFLRGRVRCMNTGLINKVDMVCLSPVGYGV